MLAGWGNYPRIETRLLRARGADEATAAILAHPHLIARGNGRAYGDAALNAHATLSILPSDRLIAFDPVSGLLTCEAGLLLADIIALFLPRGWFPPVTPGTKFVSVGGMIAADVHGKNHHGAGSFGEHVESFVLSMADGTLAHCSRHENNDLFAATCGGMGLTGIIVAATFHLMKIETAYIRQRTVRAGSLKEAMALFEQAQHWRYAVAWIDCLARGEALGRSLLYFGDHAGLDELPVPLRPTPLRTPRKNAVRIPLYFPAVALNRWSVQAFNELYYRRGREGDDIVDYDGFFYPLDALLEWNKIYSRAGFLQYQCVLPKAASLAGMTALLDRLSRAGRGSFLAVLKLLGHQDGLLSFPMEGYTLALDFPANSANFAFLTELDAIVADHGGRLYLAKDARSAPAMLRCYPRLAEFKALRQRVDPGEKFSSLLSQRLGL